MQSANDLKQLLFSINHKSYPAYKSTRGAYQFPRYTLSIDHVQGDPFAAPSRVSVHVSGKTAAFPAFLYDTYEKRVALQDYLLRQFARAIAPYSFRAKGSGKSGLLGISRCGQEILERTACVLNPSDGSLIVNMEIGFPANGRTIASQELICILFDFLPGCVEKSLFYRALDPKACANVAYLCEDQQAIRAALKEKGLTAFIADGSILPRETGVSDPADEARRSVYLSGTPARYPRSSKPRTCFRHGNSTRCHTDRRRRLPRKIHPAAGA